MIAVGAALIVASLVLGVFMPPDRILWDWRDWFTTRPFAVGCSLVLVGLIKWLWIVAP